MKHGWYLEYLKRGIWLRLAGATAIAGAFACSGAHAAPNFPETPVELPANTRLVDGRTLASADLKGKVVLVNFWATWCGYCRQELPDLSDFYKLYKDRGFEIVALSVEQDADKVAAYARARQIPFPVGLRTPAWEVPFGRARATPTAVVIDRTGRVRDVMVGTKDRVDLDKIMKLIEQGRSAVDPLAAADPVSR
ncbi:MAG: redoxin family protein [Burkholderiales bacterium]